MILSSKKQIHLDRADLFRYDENQKAQIIIQFNLGKFGMIKITSKM